MRFWITGPTVGWKVGFYAARDIAGWSLRLCLGRVILCFGRRRAPIIEGALPEKGEGEPSTILGV